MDKVSNLIKSMNFSYDSSLAKLAVIILIILIIAFLIDFLLIRSVLGKAYRIFVAPGVILHELAHTLMCLLTGAKMSKISFFEKTGGSVEHTQSKIPIIGPILISLAPFAAGSVAIYFLSKTLGLSQIDFQTLHFSQNNIFNFIGSIFRSIHLTSAKDWIIVYLVLSIAVTMTPSWQDFKNIIGSLLLIGITIFFINYFHLINFADVNVPTPMFSLLFTVILLLLLSLILSIFINVLSAIIKH